MTIQLDCVVRTVFSDQKNLVVTLLFPIFVAENRLSNEENEEDFDDFDAVLRDSITAGSVWQ